MVFDYPLQAHQRIHGPAGYESYESYRPWLRDEFSFRCVYCLRRERWGQLRGNWDIDHFEPRKVAADKALDYNNLLYACHTCNLLKSANSALDPCRVGFGALVRVDGEGRIAALDQQGQVLIQALQLDSPNLTQFRQLMIKMLLALTEQAPEIYRQWLSYPDDLPDLEPLKPPQNTRPNGVAQSCLARRLRGELPVTY